MGYEFRELELPGLLLVEGKSFPDPRGYFMESFREDEFDARGLPRFLQDNLSRSKKGVVRGMHYQTAAAAVAKLIRCVRGRVFDAVIDIRKGSPTYGTWTAVELSDEGNRMLFVPAGFAHGFMALSDEADVHYKVTGYWTPAVDRGIRWNDPAVGIKWPDLKPIIAAKDEIHPLLADVPPDYTWQVNT